MSSTPKYQQLTMLHWCFPSLPYIVLAVINNSPKRHEALEHLERISVRSFVSGFDPDIYYRIAPKTNPRS